MPDLQPSSAALAWAARIPGTSATVREVQVLTGGTHASTHLIRTTDPDCELVLRRYAAADDAAYREAHVLTALDGLGGLAPRLLDSDSAGERFGEPAVLISRLPGRADIMPADPLPWAARLGRTLARIHAAPLTGMTGFRDVLDDIPGIVGRADGPVRKRWVDLAAEPRVLTHFDYWSGNVLWEDGELTGVVDWSGASLAPRGFDVGWCRLDLVLLHGTHVADAFLLAYEDAAGTRVPHRELWDLFAIQRSRGEVENWLPNYHDLGRTDLTRQELSHRHGAWLAAL
ncbi:aminoglycoside phosphotransferase family protein [Nonomuraea deserti]|uniref:Aminoglycoside phosphotransferase family protein n=1 Tax=Nonomuraea deserti TaxID=1848322 RepID=A0A4R4V675_9ACTN|nr:aminoglycoside phosphotransferase family protein [Nonomuraea deserti]TDC98786.1 aminoglycoside phosphotransferase family protein [Nonomuraea deserti]